LAAVTPNFALALDLQAEILSEILARISDQNPYGELPKITLDVAVVGDSDFDVFKPFAGIFLRGEQGPAGPRNIRRYYRGRYLPRPYPLRDG